MKLLKWHPVALRRASTVRELYVTAGKRLTQLMRFHAAGVLDSGDAECLHQARICIRRLRVLLWCCRKLLRSREYKALHGELKWLARVFAPARDGEVFLRESWPLLRARLDSTAVIESLEAAWRLDQQQAIRECRRALRSVRYRNLMCALDSEFDAADKSGGRVMAREDAWHEEARRYMRHMAKRSLRQVYERVRAIDYRDMHKLHRLRIEIKRTRYGLEMATPVWRTGRISRLLDALSKMQDSMGAIHDCAAAGAKISARISAMKQPGAAGEAINRAQRLLERRQAKLSRKLARTVRLYRRAYKG